MIVLYLAIVVCGLSGDAAARTSRMAFHGNRIFSSSELESFLNVAATESLRAADLEARLPSVIDSLVVRDRVFAKVESVRFVERKGRRISHVYLSEGPLAEVAAVRWLGDSTRVSPEIASRAECRAGAVFRWDCVHRDAELLLDYFEANGYPFARVDVDSVVTDDSASTVSAWLRLNSGPFIRVDFLAFEANRHTSDYYLGRESRLRIGQPYSQPRIDAAWRRLSKLEFLRRVDPAQIAADKGGRNGLLFRVEEAPATRIDAVAGYQPKTGNREASLSGLVNVEFLNLLGTGRRGRIRWERPDRRIQDIELSYREPWVLRQPLGLRLDFGQRIEDTLYVRRRFALRGEADLSSWVGTWFTIQRELVIADSASSEALGLPDNSTSYLEAGISYDSRDYHVNPRTGVLFSSFAGTGWRDSHPSSGSAAGGSFRQQRAGVDSEIAQELWPLWVADLSVHARILDTTEPEYLLPDLYRLGGARTLRGYREEQFLGSRIGWGSAELRYLLARASRVFIFYDAGGIYYQRKTATESANSTTLKSGAGLGLRIESNLGIWGIDYGIGENDRLLNGKLHVSLLSLF